MNLEEILDVVDKYNKLQELAESKAILLEKLDPGQYYLYGYTRRIEIEEESVFIQYHDYDGSSECYVFPTNFLTMNDSEITILVEQEKYDREKVEEKVNAEAIAKDAIIKKEQERLEYIRLKAKFEGEV